MEQKVENDKFEWKNSKKVYLNASYWFTWNSLVKNLLAKGFAVALLVSLGLLSYDLYFEPKQPVFLEPSSNVILPRQETKEAEAEVVEKEVNAPPPLRYKQVSQQSFLSVAGVINNTNAQRALDGLAPLVQNTTLNMSALIKAQDMLDKQYFEHVSPEGVGAGDLASQVGYDYIAIGENLALGNFANDEVLVQGWMDSPGHRENILKSSYTQIGVSVLKGNFEGVGTWMAVQHFGRPLSACPTLDSNLKSTIDNSNTRLNALTNELNALDAYLSSTDPIGQEYAQKVDEYNTKVAEYNALVEDTKGLIGNYNAQIEAFNTCVAN